MRRTAWALFILAAGVFAAASLYLGVLSNLNTPWTSVRLAPTFALLRGDALYSMSYEGPWTMIGYGPLYPVMYLPAALGHEPWTVIGLATLTAHLHVMLPVGFLAALFCQQLAGRTQRSCHWLPVVLAFLLLANIVPSLRYIVYSVHVDAPASGLFLWAMYCSLRSCLNPGSRSSLWLALGGLAIGLAAACKPNYAAAIVTLGLLLSLVRGWRGGLGFIVLAFTVFFTAYAIGSWQSSPEAVLHNLKVLKDFPWTMPKEALETATVEPMGKLKIAIRLLFEYLRDYGAAIVTLALLIPWLKWTSRKDWLHSPFLMPVHFVCTALMLMPVSIASYGKYGGDVNSCALFSLPLTLAVLFTLVIHLPGSLTRLLHVYMAGYACLALLAVALVSGRLLWHRSFAITTLEESYKAIKAQPNETYFPFDPLGHFLVEGKARPNMDCIYSYSVPGFPVDEEAFRRELPPDLKYIGFPPSAESWGGAELRRLLPEFQKAEGQQPFVWHEMLERR